MNKKPFKLKLNPTGTHIRSLAMAVARALDNPQPPVDNRIRLPDTPPKPQEKLP